MNEVMGKPSDMGMAVSGSKRKKGRRERGWLVDTFKVAMALKKKLEKIKGVTAGIRET